MLDNYAYNLMSQIVEDHRSLWRMRDVYENDCGEVSGCREMWSKMAEDRERELDELVERLKAYLAQ